MSDKQLKAFQDALMADAVLKENISAAADLEAVAALAKEAGFEIPLDAFRKAKTELSDEDLEGLAGGVERPPTKRPNCLA